ncbi:MAG: protein-L-isoaspartate(D-aspartate) O-methyltransferase [Burkholderiaceae bacterium]
MKKDPPASGRSAGAGVPRPRPAFPARLPEAGPARPTVPRSTVPRLSPSAAVSGARASATARPAAGPGLDSTAFRTAMVRRLQGQGLAHPGVLAALQAVERHRFVDSALVGQAYEDTSLPIGLGQTISKPSVVGRMAELLCEGTDGRLGRVLEIGTGCGYQAAVLSHLSREVYSIERLRGLHEKARENLRWFRLPNVHLIFGDGMLGFERGAPYAGIIAAAGGEDLPQAWLDQLAVGGRLVAPARSASGQQHLVVVDRTSQGWTSKTLDVVNFVPLKSGTA